MSEFISALIGAALVNQLLLGLPAAEGQRHAHIQALGPANALLMFFTAPLTWLLHRLLPADLGYLSLILMLPLLAALAWFSLALLAKLRPNLAQPSLLWPLLLINGAGLSLMLISQALPSLPIALAVGLVAGLGFWLLLQLFTDLLERAAQCDVPTPFKGTPLLLICAGLLSLAFLGCNGLGPI
jgi:Na+-translocating ferredoxin:NAD+ oxidoreductase subunit A